MAFTRARTKLGMRSDGRDRAKHAAESAIEKIGAAAQDAVSSVASTVGPALDDTRDRLSSAAQEAVTSVASTVGPALDDTRDRITPLVSDARDRVTPVMQDARVRLSPVVDNAREKLAPAASTALAAGRLRGRRAAVRLGFAEEEPVPQKSHRLRNLLIVVGLGGAAAFVYSKVTGRDADPAWTAGRDSAAVDSPSIPTAPVAPAQMQPADANGAEEDQSDTAPTAPLASEETVESHTPTTPDEPLERKDL